GEGLSLRQKVLRLVEVRHTVNKLGVTVSVSHGLSATSARDRIRIYLSENVGVVLEGEELAVVSGISEYARRIRELRVEHGYRILTGASPDPNSGVELSPDEYLLISPEPDQDAARRWAIANRIRRSEQGSRDRVLHFLQENVARVVTTEDLAYVAKGAKEFARRIRELRTEEGYAIATRFTGRPDLRMGEYVLLSADRVAEPHDRQIPLEVQREVYERDCNTCTLCGWNTSQWSEGDPRILELHHMTAHVSGGANVAANLKVLCSRCHDGVHAGRIAPPDC
ncbi:MAG: HNH endonuclease, partial [Phycisphaerae bacterium]|nr:HNH endonuclease [Phycisphaerae bacterium]